MASAMAYFQANRGKLSGQISANVVSSSRTSEGINYSGGKSALHQQRFKKLTSFGYADRLFLPGAFIVCWCKACP